eukprot:6195107-Pleurochrysis_carterae.AAC.1
MLDVLLNQQSSYLSMLQLCGQSSFCAAEHCWTQTVRTSIIAIAGVCDGRKLTTEASLRDTRLRCERVTNIPLHSISHARELRTPSPDEPQVWRRRRRGAASLTLSPWARQPECCTARATQDRWRHALRNSRPYGYAYLHVCAYRICSARARCPSPPCPPSAFALLRTGQHMEEVMISEARMKTNN